MLWSVGTAFFDDPKANFPESVRVKFTAMSLLVHHPLVREVVLVDNNPDPNNPLIQLAAGTHNKIRYFPMKSPQGTSPPRNKVFEVSTSEFVACIDSHVLLCPGFFESLNRFYEEKGNTSPDLLHGVMVNERGEPTASHMNDQWRAEMWGTWGTAWIKDGVVISCLTRDDLTIEFVRFAETGATFPIDSESVGIPKNFGWAGHEQQLKNLGWTQPESPFAIPGHGMGFFACRKDSWLPFHEGARGFGGEEMTTGVRYRQAIRKCWCIPSARWWHDYRRPMANAQGQGGIPYRLTRWDKVRNYVLEFQRLGLDVNIIKQHFKGFPESEWRQIVQGKGWPSQFSKGVNPKTVAPRPADIPPDFAVPLTGGCGPGKSAELAERGLAGLYENVLKNKSNVSEDASYLKELAAKCGPDDGPGRVVELGTYNALSTVCLLSGSPKSLHTFENGRVRLAEQLSKLKPEGTDYKYVNAAIGDIPDCDLLFVNLQPHTAETIFTTLNRYHEKVSRYVAIHGTVVYGEFWNGQPGLLPGVRGFIKKHKEWTTVRHHLTKHGLIVLSKNDRDKKQPPDIMRKALNFGIAVFQHATNGFTPTPKEEKEKRIEICVLCDKRWHDVCGECGCPIESRTSWKEQVCPIKRW